jgi:hypothetical protein
VKGKCANHLATEAPVAQKIVAQKLNCGSEKDSVIGCLPGSHHKEIEYKNVKPVAVIDMA